MADKQRKSLSFAIFITVMVMLLIGAIALFIYGSMTNGIIAPRLPSLNGFARGTILCHG